MKNTVTAKKESEEIEWWNQWNSTHRTEAFNEDTDEAQTGRLALAELLDLQLEWPGILEVGCGTGWLADQLVSRGSYLGLDLSPAAIEVARREIPDGRFLATDFCSWESPEPSFDVILMVDTIAYFRDQDKALNKATQLLKPGGVLILTTVNPFVYSRMSWITPPTKGLVRNWLSREALHGMLESNSLRILKSKTAFPAGDQGILRLINNRKLNRALTLFSGEKWLNQIKEKIGLGRYRLVVAQLPKS